MLSPTSLTALIELLVFHNDPIASKKIGLTTDGLEYGEFNCWIGPAVRYWFRVASISSTTTGLMRRRREVTGAPPSGTEMSRAFHGF